MAATTRTTRAAVARPAPPRVAGTCAPMTNPLSRWRPDDQAAHDVDTPPRARPSLPPVSVFRDCTVPGRRAPEAVRERL